MLEDNAIVRRIVAGDTEAFRHLVDRYRRPVFCMVANLVPCNHDAEDVAQEVFLAAFENLHRFDARKSRFCTWLLTIARNKSLDLLRKKRPVVTEELPERVVWRTPADEVAGGEFIQRLDEALDGLPPRLKTVFVLTEFVGLDTAEIARIEGIRESSVRSRLSRAKRRLQTWLAPQCEGETR